MLKVQLNLGYGVNWFDIQKDGKRWIAFYYDGKDISQYNVSEELNEPNQE